MGTEAHSAETRKLIQAVSRETAKCVSLNVSKKVVHETLISVGIDPSDPIAAQEMQSSMRKIAEIAPALSAIASHYSDQENVEAIIFAKNIHKAVKSSRNRIITGSAAAGVALWWSGLMNKVFGA